MPADPIVEIRRLTRSFDGVQVLRTLNLTLRPGERVALTGPNGSGKSTLLRCVVGTLSPTAGDVRVCGHPAGSLQARAAIGSSLSQERSFYLRLSGFTNLLFYANFRYDDAVTARRQVASVVEELDLGEIALERVDRCSTGMVQQLAFGRALLGAPAVLALDEPTRSMDTQAVERFWAALNRRPAIGVLLATHLANDVRSCGSTLELS